MISFRGVSVTLRRRICAIAAVLLLPSTAISQVQVNQAFVPQGPAPSSGPKETVQSGDAPPNGTVAGAVQAILLDPALGPNTMFIASPNGGVWDTTNGGATWTPLTDKQASLSIASLGLDTTDPTGKTLIAGVGLTSNGIWDAFNRPNRAGSGGQQTGLLYSTDGGKRWTSMGGAALAGQSVIGVAARGSTILAATFEEQAPTVTRVGTAGAQYGLYRSTDGGKTFALASGLPAGPVTALVADPANSNTFYASVTSPTNPGATGVYVSTNSGKTWSPVFTSSTTVSGGTNIITGATDQLVPKLAAGPNGSVAIAIANVKSDGSADMKALYLSQNSGQTWSALATPVTNAGVHQAVVNLAVAIDPSNTTVVYVTGDGIDASPYTVPAFRVQGDVATSLTDKNTANDSTAHADSRVLVVNAAGNLVMGSDGGIYIRTNPQSAAGQWQGLNTSTLQIREPYAVAYGANSQRLIVAAQDTGISIQSAPNSTLYNSIQGADGVNAVVSDKTFANQSVYYNSYYNFGSFSRLVLDANGNTVSPGSILSGVPVTCNGRKDCASQVDGQYFYSPIELNRVNPTRIALAGGHVYVTQDTAPATATSVDLALTDLGATGGSVSALAYGTRDNTNVLLAGNNNGASGGGLFLSATGAAGSISRVAAYAGQTPTSLVFDQRSQNRFYVADSFNLWSTQNQGATIQNLTPNLTALNIIRPTSVEFINNNGVNALLVGGLGAIADGSSQIAVADSNKSGALQGWRPFGSGLPNVLISRMAYNPLADVLALSAVGRGAWSLYDVTSYFSQATVLQFGLANNDSKPDASFLVDGTNLDGTRFVRPLVKYGTGALTLDGAATYTGPTSVEAGVLSVNGSITSPVFVNSGGELSGSGSVGATKIGAGGALAPGATTIGTLTINGDLTANAGSVYSVRVSGATADRAFVNGAATLAGEAVVSFQAGGLSNKYSILAAVDGTSGAFSDLIAMNAPSFMTASLEYTPNNVQLDLTSGLSRIAGLTPNQSSVAAALDNAFNRGGGFLTGLFGLTPVQIPGALGMLSGEGASATQETAFGANDMFVSAMMDQGAFWRNDDAGDAKGNTFRSAALAYAASDKGERPALAAIRIHDPVEESNRWRSWYSGFDGSWSLQGQQPTPGSSSISHRAAGGAAGLDYEVNPDLLLGIASAGSYSSFSAPGLLTSGYLEGFQFGGYGVAKAGSLYAALATAVGYFDNNTSRTIAGVGPTETARGEFGSELFSTRLEVGGKQSFEGIAVTPFGAVQYSALRQNSYAETSNVAGLPGVLGLSYTSHAAPSLPTFLGAQLDMRKALPNGIILAPYFRASWVHEFDPNRRIAASFETVPGALFMVDGPQAARDAARIDAGLKLAIGQNFSLFAIFDGEFSGREQMYAGSAGLKISW